MQVRNKIGTEVIFVFEESILDIVYEISGQNEPLCVLVMFFEQEAPGTIYLTRPGAYVLWKMKG